MLLAAMRKLNSDDKIYSATEIIEGSKNFDGILSSVTDPINSDTISKLSSSIKIIANGAVGFGNIDIKAAQEKGIIVTNTPDVLTDATADIQILLLLGASRKAYEGRIAAETQSWKWSWDFLLGKQMSNKRLGILGMGRPPWRSSSVDSTPRFPSAIPTGTNSTSRVNHRRNRRRFGAFV